MTFNDILTEFRQSITQKEKGTKFERLMRSWLLTDPRFNQLQTVWMWDDFPAKNEISMFGDVGIDLVARTELGEYWAIQCKCYAESAQINKGDVDTFLSTSSKTFMCPFTHTKMAFSNRLWISTTNNWGKNAEDAIANQTIPVSRINLYDLEISPVNWDELYNGQEGTIALIQAHKVPRDHQLRAISAAKKYYIDDKNERGKLIMACGTGKTYTSLRIVEDLLDQKGLILFLVPSISLLGQTLNEWSFDAQKKIKAVCICSDATASRNRNANNDNDDIQHTMVDLAAPANTDPKMISIRLRAFQKHDGLVVVFSTYQSIDAVYEAQKQVLVDTNGAYGKFDFIICDEAHRTTGARVKGQDDSDFSKIHNADYIQGARRLYMTATPKVYSDTLKAKAVDEDFVLYSMDNEAWYGKEFFHVGFGYAVEHGLLTDYKVFVLTVSEDDIPQDLQMKIKSNANQELTYNDTAKLVGVISGLSKIIAGDKGETWNVDPRLMHRALAFCGQIGDTNKSGSSKNVAAILPAISEEILKDKTAEERTRIVSVDARHVDGSMTSAHRAQDLKWLASEPEFDNQCRVITNVRCLSEGVDVPALDAVIFLSARNSQVDVVQSVGRVMRNFGKGTADEKKYGYIIIPVVIPTDADPGTILDANDFKTVWSILNALRSHDDRFNAHVNQINLNKDKKKKIVVGGSGIGNMAIDPETLDTQLELRFGKIEDKIYAKLVEKVGDRMYWENWAKEMGAIARQFIARINKEVESGEYKHDMDEFVKSLQKNLNPSITQDDAIEMLAQHMITKPVFDALFSEYQFVKNNSVSRSMEAMLLRLHGDAFEKDTEVLQKFYESVRMNVAGIDNLHGKQTIIKNLYEKFFAGAFKTTVEQLGIVYTPIECVDFIIRSVDDLLRKEFGVSISDEGVHILDPFTGTGTFVTRLLQSGLIKKEDLVRKYTSEIHCNEIVLLAYYIADVNIEAVFHDLTNRQEYLPYNGICLTDTFQLAEPVKNEMFTPFFQQNNENVLNLRKQTIRVIIGNPPYSKGQKNANDNAQNLSYKVLDSRIADTYLQETNTTLVRGSYDSYIRAIRWASDKIPMNEGGIIGFITNSGWLDKNGFTGFRASIEKEFSSIYVVDLRGAVRAKDRETAKREGENVFDIMTGVAMIFLVKNPACGSQKAKIHYYNIGDYLTRKEKLQKLHDNTIDTLDFQNIVPNEKYDWINQRDGSFESLIPLSPGREKIKECVFNNILIGVATNRDVWVTNFSRNELSRNMSSCIKFYNSEVDKLSKDIYYELSLDSTKISWTRGLKRNAENLTRYSYLEESVIGVQYRPFVKTNLYYHKPFIESPGRWDNIFPESLENIVICVSGTSARKSFNSYISNCHTDLNVMEAGTQCFPLYWYEENEKAQRTLFDEATDDKYIRHDGITDWILKEVRGRFSGTKMITKETIFYYVYGLLHSPQYRTRFADDLRKSLPRIPIVDKIEDFMLFSKIGKQLADLHLNYEQVPPAEQVKVFMNNCPVSKEQLQTWFAEPNGEELLKKAYPYYSVEKMRFEKVRDENGKLVPDKSVIIYNNNIRLENIPLEAYDYIVNGKSAIEWIMERYAISTDSASGITNDPNDWSKEHQKPTYILDLLLSIINLSLQTNKLVDQLPSLPFALDAPKHEASKQQDNKTNNHKKKHHKNKNHGVTYNFHGPVTIYKVDTINNDKDDHSQHLHIENPKK